MILPKRRVYRFQVAAAVLCIGLSGLVVAIGALSTHALMEPNIYRHQDTTNSTSPEPSSSPQKNDSTSDTAKQNNNTSTVTTSRSSQATSSTTIANPPAQATVAKTPARARVISPQPQVQPVAPAPVSDPQPAVDTSAQALQLASAQAGQIVVPTQYATAKISTSEKNNLYEISMVAATVGLVLYLLSYVPVWWRSFARTPAFASKIVTE